VIADTSRTPDHCCARGFRRKPCRGSYHAQRMARIATVQRMRIGRRAWAAPDLGAASQDLHNG
jgi:hypothetical protein